MRPLRPAPVHTRAKQERAMDLRIRLVTLFGLAVLVAACGRAARPFSSTAAGGSPVPTSGIAFVSERDGNQEIYLIQPDGTHVARLTSDPALDADPAWAPDGRRLAFRSRRDGSSDLFIMNADGTQPQNLIGDPRDSLDDEFAPAWSPDGTTLALITDRFALGGCSPHQVALLPLAGDATALRRLGALEGNQRTVTWSPDGRRLVFSSHCLSADVNLYLWDTDSRALATLTQDPAIDSYPAWSPDGAFLAFQSTRDGNAEIYLLELATASLTNLTRHPADDTQPTWSPDGSQLAFVTDRDGNYEIYTMNSDGTQPRNLTQHPARDFWPAWSPVP
jgi:Tol biopolymer transport system component